MCIRDRAEPAAEGGEIVIGCLQDITGATSALGMSVQAGAQAAVDEIDVYKRQVACSLHALAADSVLRRLL